MSNRMICIPYNDTQNYPFYNQQLKRLDIQLNETANHKLLDQRIRKRYYKTLGFSVINIPMSPPSLDRNKDRLKHSKIIQYKKILNQIQIELYSMNCLFLLNNTSISSLHKTLGKLVIAVLLNVQIRFYVPNLA